MYVCVPVCVTHMSVSLRPEEGIWSSGAGEEGWAAFVDENKTLSLRRGESFLDRCAISQDSTFVFLLGLSLG